VSINEPAPLTAEQLRRLTIAQIEAWLAGAPGSDSGLCALLEKDPRQGVRRLGVRLRQEGQRQEAERARLARLLELERRLWDRRLERIAGVDEVGRGCLAGPVVAAAVILREGCFFPGLDDSKKLSPEKRGQLATRIIAEALAIGLGVVEAGEIDRTDILQASLKAMRLALASLGQEPQHVLVDGSHKPGSPFPETAVVAGDSRSLSIAAASVVAKVHRDRLMAEWDGRYPQYGFAGHKGYGSPEHLEALAAHGPCPLHRRSFAPVARLQGFSAAFGVFKEGLESCQSRFELERFSRFIRQGAGELRPHELRELRRVFRARRQALETGPRGEEFAARFLEARGCQVLWHRYRGAGGEIDLVARQGDCLVFVEVKSRKGRGLGEPEERVDRAKQERLVRAARHYCARHPEQGKEYRFDVIAVIFGKGEPQITHIPDAFQA